MDKPCSFHLLVCRHNHEIPVKITQVEGQYLLCLNQKEALMMASVFQASLLHEPTRMALLSRSDYATFHQQMMRALAHSGSAAPSS
jgi:hypothetical protein